MAAVVPIRSRKTGERRIVFTVDARELLKGSNEEGWEIEGALYQPTQQAAQPVPVVPAPAAPVKVAPKADF